MYRFASIGTSLHRQEAADDGRDADDANPERENGGWNEPGEPVMTAADVRATPSTEEQDEANTKVAREEVLAEMASRLNGSDD